MMTDSDAPRLKDRIDDFLEQMAAHVPPEVARTLSEELSKLAQSGIAKRSLQNGERAPDFTLPDAHRTPVRLGELLQRGPVVLTFYRGGWCPFCNLQLRAYQQMLPSLRERGAELVAVSPQTPDYTLSTVEEKELTFPVLSDVGNRVAALYGLVYTLSDALQSLQKSFGNPIPKFNGDDSWQLPMPGTFVIDRGGVVRLAFVDPDYTRRLEPTLILDAVREIVARGG
jgi:peroxiredoxin